MINLLISYPEKDGFTQYKLIWLLVFSDSNENVSFEATILFTIVFGTEPQRRVNNSENALVPARLLDAIR